MTAYLLILIHTFPSSYLPSARSSVATLTQQAETTSKDICFGQRQVEQFICDRPATAKIIQRNKELRYMLVWYFAGKPSGGRIYWDNGQPQGSPEAEHLPAGTGYPSLVKISDKLSPADQCAGLLFELLNFPVDAEYKTLVEAAKEQRKSQNDFAESCARLEFEAMKSTRVFLLEHPIPGTNWVDDPVFSRIVTCEGDTDGYIRYLRLTPNQEYLDYYRSAYDQLLRSQAASSQKLSTDEK